MMIFFKRCLWHPRLHLSSERRSTQPKSGGKLKRVLCMKFFPYSGEGAGFATPNPNPHNLELSLANSILQLCHASELRNGAFERKANCK